MDASSDLWVELVLSQPSSKDGKLHPCAFWCRKLSTAQQNYAVGDQDLLTIKVTLEEYRHWLEGAEQPFLVWTNHMNFKYIKNAKRLNPRQPNGLCSFRASIWHCLTDPVHRISSKIPCPDYFVIVRKRTRSQ